MDATDDAGADAATDSSADADEDAQVDTGPDIDPTLDTDEDGVLDIDEILVWGTSPTVADTDGDGFSDGLEINELNFDPDVDNYQFNPRIADRPILDIELALAPVLYATYETSEGASRTIGRERSAETREATSRSWGGSNSYAVEHSHTVGASAGFEGWSLTGSVSYEYSYSTTRETSNDWSNEQSQENARTLSDMREYESSTEISRSGGVLGVSALVRNPGDIAYFLENLTLTAYELDPQSPASVTPVGTLTFLDESGLPRTRLEPGETSAPLGFDTDLDLPTVQRLLADSRNLMIAPATWLVTGDGSVDFELAATSVNARTAEIIIDYGDARDLEVYRIATDGDDDQNFVTVAEAFDEILRVDWTDGVIDYQRSPDTEPEPTNPFLTSVRGVTANDEEAALWTVVHVYPINSGADTQVDQYHPLADELDFGALELQKGHTLQLVRIVDVDRDWLGERGEYAFGTDPNDPDTDGDGCIDGFEVVGQEFEVDGETVRYRSDPADPNTDNDLVDDCDEYAAGTNPSDTSNAAPVATVEVGTADGVRVVFNVGWTDVDSPNATEIRYTLDDDDEVIVPLEATAPNPIGIELFIREGGRHTFTARVSDGSALSEPVSVDYTVGPPSGAVHTYGITGSTDETFSGVVDGLNATSVSFVSGRDGTPRGAAHTYLRGEPGLLQGGPFALDASYSWSAWVRADGIFSPEVAFGQAGVFAVEIGPDGVGLFDMAGQVFTRDDNRIAGTDRSTWSEGDWLHVAVAVDGRAAAIYLNGELVGTGTMSTDVRPRCEVFWGKPAGNEVACNDLDRAESFENGLRAAFDDLRIFNRALSQYEVEALFVSLP